MNIAQAKEELINTVKTYLAKDKDGCYRIPRVRQRPILLMGPPGIGKTAIMEQVARECEIGLVSYTMTHHTRQSAIGLPVVETRNFDGQEYTVTEYTMSEIIASVYGLMERTGYREGILFLDEINCVSETLAPVMLQFLQNKAFGSHQLPSGWIIATAGNPRDYNKSAREFDIATLDRVRKINILPDLDAWKKYALSAGIHGSILSYLNCRPASFYHIHQTIDAMEFVTARGWEDLSVVLQEYEYQSILVTVEMIKEYLMCDEIAEDFYAHYMMTREYKKHCPIDRILDGTLTEKEEYQLQIHFQKAEKDETFSVSGWLLTGVLYNLKRAEKAHAIWKRLEDMIEIFLSYVNRNAGKSVIDILEEYIDKSLHALSVKEQNGLIQEPQIQEEKEGINSFRISLSYCKGNQKRAKEEIQKVLYEQKMKKKEIWEKAQTEAAFCVLRAIRFITKVFGRGEEIICFLTGIYLHPEMKELETWKELQDYREALVWMRIEDREKQIEKLLDEK